VLTIVCKALIIIQDEYQRSTLSPRAGPSLRNDLNLLRCGLIVGRGVVIVVGNFVLILWIPAGHTSVIIVLDHVVVLGNCVSISVVRILRVTPSNCIGGVIWTLLVVSVTVLGVAEV
jgi:hypothetical protein